MRSDHLVLSCHVGGLICGLPLAHVIETLRPLPVEPLPGMPPFVLGLSVVRGAAIPVVDARLLLGVERPGPCRRYVTLSLGARRAALAVDEVIGVRALDLASLEELPPLLGSLAAELVAAITNLDASLLIVLHGARLVPDSAWSTPRAPA